MKIRMVSMTIVVILCCFAICSCSVKKSTDYPESMGVIGNEISEMKIRLREFEDETHLLNYKGDTDTLISDENPEGINPFGPDGAKIAELIRSSDESDIVTENVAHEVTIGSTLESVRTNLGAPLYSCILKADSIDDGCSKIEFAYEIHLFYLLDTGRILDVGLDQSIKLYPFLPTSRSSVRLRAACASGYKVCSAAEYSFDDLKATYAAYPVNERISEVKTSFGLPAAYTNLTLTDPYYAFDKEHRVQEGMNYFQQEKEDGTQALL